MPLHRDHGPGVDELNDLKIPATDRDDDLKSDWNTVTLQVVGERMNRLAKANVARKSFREPVDANAACRADAPWPQIIRGHTSRL